MNGYTIKEINRMDNFVTIIKSAFPAIDITSKLSNDGVKIYAAIGTGKFYITVFEPYSLLNNEEKVQYVRSLLEDIRKDLSNF